MDLVLLPEEIVILIVKKLDFQSQINLHATCSYLKTIVTLYGVVKVCNVPPGPLASPSVLKLDFFKSISGHLKVINLCAVRNLTKSAILPTLKNLKCLETLDVSYTNIIIPDLVDMKKVCSTLKNISVNFLFGKFKMGVRVPFKVLVQCQDVFQYFENVEFVGVKGNLMQSKLPFYVLSKATLLNEVKFTVIKNNHTIYQSEDCDKLFRFNQLQILLLPWNQANNQSGHNTELYSVILPMLDKTKIEYIIIHTHYDMTVPNIWASDVFRNFFESNCGEPPSHLERFDGIDLSKNICIFIWNKETTLFNEAFFCNLWCHIKYLLPLRVASSHILELAPISKDIDWLVVYFDTNARGQQHLNGKHSEPLAKKQRVGVKSHVLDYDHYLKEINNVKLTLNFFSHADVCLNHSSRYLRKLTYLNLMGRVNFCGDFFKVLFGCCEKLETLNVEVEESLLCAKFISNAICLSSRLKNIRLEERIQGNDINILLNSLGKCKEIENIHIYNKNKKITELNDLSFLVAKCTKLYSIYVRNIMSDNNRIKTFRLLNNAKTKYGRPYLNVELNCIYAGDSYDPYISVFNLNPLKRI